MKPDLHLSEEALDDLLIGMGSSEAEKHLAHCATCRARVLDFQKNMELLDQISMAWSRQRAAGLGDLPQHGGTRRLPLTTMGWAIAAVLFAAVAFPVWRNLDRPRTGSVQPPAIHQEDSETQIAQDNELLRAVDAALDTNETLPFADAPPSPSQNSHTAARPE